MNNHMIKSSSNGRLKGSLITPQAISRDKIQMGRSHCIVNMKTGFPANINSLELDNVIRKKNDQYSKADKLTGGTKLSLGSIYEHFADFS